MAIQHFTVFMVVTLSGLQVSHNRGSWGGWGGVVGGPYQPAVVALHMGVPHVTVLRQGLPIQRLADAPPQGVLGRDMGRAVDGGHAEDPELRRVDLAFDIQDLL